MKKYIIIFILILPLMNISASPIQLWNHSETDDILCLTTADVDNDNIKDIIAGSKNYNIIAIRSDGKLLWNYTATKPVNAVFSIDINNDGNNEVLAGDSYGVLFVLSHTGQLLWNYTNNGSAPVTEIYAADINNDGAVEIIIGTSNNYTKVLTNNGTLLWEYNLWQPVSDIDIIDYDNDGKKEIVVGCGWGSANNGNKIFLLSHNGSYLWNYTVGNDVQNSLSVGDLDGDGISDIFCGSDENAKFFAIKSDGTQLWNYSAIPDTSSPFARHTTIIDDINNDGINEIICSSTGSSNGVLYVFSSAGTLLWSYTIDGWAYSVFTANVYGDSKKEVILSTSWYEFSNNNTVHVFTYYGELIGQFNCSDRVVDVLAADLNNDGFYEVIAASWDNNIYAYKFDFIDLVLELTNITILKNSVTFNVKIRKEMGGELKNVNISLYANDILIDSLLINFSDSGSVLVSFNCTVSSFTTLKIIVDPDNIFLERTKTNNEAIIIYSPEKSESSFFTKYGFYMAISALVIVILVALLRR